MSNRTEIFEMSARTYAGLENVLADELTRLGAQQIKPINKGVYFEGDKSILYRANICLRTSTRVLKPLIKFSVDNPRYLQKKVMDIDWSEYITLLNTFDVDVVVKSANFKNPNFVSQKIKDAIAEQFRKKTGKRPFVDTSNPSLKILTHILDDQCTISLDSSGELLNHRGYRQDFHDGIINEVLSAGMIMRTGWDRQSCFIDPLCGNGSFLVEAAMIGNKMSPGLNRKDFAFKHWKDYDESLFNKILDEEKRLRTEFRGHIWGSDIVPTSIVAARGNIKRAGLENKIEIGLRLFDKNKPDVASGVLILNTCERDSSSSKDLSTFYSSLQQKFQNQYTGFEKWIISGNTEIIARLGFTSLNEIIFSVGQNKIYFNRIADN